MLSFCRHLHYELISFFLLKMSRIVSSCLPSTSTSPATTTLPASQNNHQHAGHLPKQHSATLVQTVHKGVFQTSSSCVCHLMHTVKTPLRRTPQFRHTRRHLMRTRTINRPSVCRFHPHRFTPMEMWSFEKMEVLLLFLLAAALSGVYRSRGSVAENW